MYLIYKINLPRGDLSSNPVGYTDIFKSRTLGGDITKTKRAFFTFLHVSLRLDFSRGHVQRRRFRY